MALSKNKCNTPSQVPCEPLKLNAPLESEKWETRSKAEIGNKQVNQHSGCKVIKVFFISKTTVNDFSDNGAYENRGLSCIHNVRPACMTLGISVQAWYKPH
ncbi:hypothetical protein BT96DRAFT_948617 [Gymnopus androsaceus JB14]|uniref:Uncharacterized protein n=1 Tax=Gymnopus androsaceus JB14 TaxID=1447944 RepID=A0A6A4GPL0_9AGAR|nr:hypothetical protein BT96DRAFT_948617 [Gymnopus androsaceus JB14]